MIVSASGPEGEMTKEEVSEPADGDTVLGSHSTLSSRPHSRGLERPVTHQVTSAPMPSDCGEDAHTCSNMLSCGI